MSDGTGSPIVSGASFRAFDRFKSFKFSLIMNRGYKLANDGVDTRTIQAYLGHKSIQHTVRYTELAPTRFKSLFRD
jgi:type 1 fimbriae regulatory protein FimB/type 1 fimbriae regulatory protein FimE